MAYSALSELIKQHKITKAELRDLALRAPYGSNLNTPAARKPMAFLEEAL